MFEINNSNQFGFDVRDYDLKVKLSKCCYDLGAVYLARYIPNGEHIVVKKFSMDLAKEEANSFRDEILIMRQFSHPNLLYLYTAFVYKFEVYYITPLMCYGSCRDTIVNCFQLGFPEILIALILRDVLLGLEYLHRKGFIHRSIRCSHILLNQTRAVISGFRDCSTILKHGERIKSLHELAPNSIKSLKWLAPEVLEQNVLGYTEKSDLYSVGITACEMANGIEPFFEMKSTFMLTEKLRGNQPSPLDCSTCTPPIPDNDPNAPSTGRASTISNMPLMYSRRKFSESFHKFTDSCMQRYPIDRPSVIQILNHNFFKQCKYTSILDQLKDFGVEVIDYSKIRDTEIPLADTFHDMSLNAGNFEWDFDS